MTSFSKFSQIVLKICRSTEHKVDITITRSLTTAAPHHDITTFCLWSVKSCVCFTELNTYIQLNNPKEGDEEKIERHKETEGAADIRNGFALRRRHQQVRRREGERCRVGSIKGGDGREAASDVPILSTRHSCSETGGPPLQEMDTVWAHVSPLLMCDKNKPMWMGMQRISWMMFGAKNNCATMLIMQRRPVSVWHTMNVTYIKLFQLQMYFSTGMLALGYLFWHRKGEIHFHWTTVRVITKQLTNYH